MAGGRGSHAQRASQRGGEEREAGLPAAQRFALLQAIMTRSWMKETEALALFTALDAECGGGASYAHTVADINAGLSPLLLALSHIKYPADGQKYVGFVNQESDAVAKAHGTSFSNGQVQYLKGLVEAIALDPDARAGVGSLSAIDALNTRPGWQSQTQASQAGQPSQEAATTKLSMHEKEAALALFVKQGWLGAAPGLSGHYTLGVRTFLELRAMLLELELPPATQEAWQSFL